MPSSSGRAYDAFCAGDLEIARDLQRNMIQAWRLFQYGNVWGGFEALPMLQSSASLFEKALFNASSPLRAGQRTSNACQRIPRWPRRRRPNGGAEGSRGPHRER